MRRLLPLGLLVGALAGCASTRPILFIATPGYVEARIAATERSIREEYDALFAAQRSQIERLQADLRAYRSVAEELLGLALVIREIEAGNAELRRLAGEFEARLAEVPQETVRLIIRALSEEMDRGP